MRDPAGKEQDPCSRLHIQRRLTGKMKKIPCVVQRHDDHDETANDVDRMDAMFHLAVSI